MKRGYVSKGGRGRVAIPAARAFEKVPFSINFLDEKFAQAANEEPRVRLL